MIKAAKKYVKIYIILAVAFSASLLLTSLLPLQPIRENAFISVLNLEEHGFEHSLIQGNDASNLDGFTDMLMATMAQMPTTPIKRAFYNEMPILYEPNNGAFSEFILQGGATYSYGRYWHGWQVWLRPLLLFCTNTYILLGTAIFALFFWALCLICEKLSIYHAAAFFATLTFIAYFFTAAFCWQYFSVFAITIASIIHILRKGTKTGTFFIIGALTTFFDIFTFPLLTLTFPAAISYAKGEKNWLKTGLEWFCGYALLWATKIFLSEAIFHADVLKNAATQISMYTHLTELPSRLFAVLTIWALTFGKFSLLALILSGAIMLYVIIFNTRAYPLLILAIIPLIWAYALPLHSFRHGFYVHKIIAGTAFALLCAIPRFPKMKKGELT